MRLAETVFVLPARAGRRRTGTDLHPVHGAPLRRPPRARNGLRRRSARQSASTTVRIETEMARFLSRSSANRTDVVFGRMDQPSRCLRPTRTPIACSTRSESRDRSSPSRRTATVPSTSTWRSRSEDAVAAVSTGPRRSRSLGEHGAELLRRLGVEVEDPDVRTGARCTRGRGDRIGSRAASRAPGEARPDRLRSSRSRSARERRSAGPRLCSRARTDRPTRSSASWSGDLP